MTKKNATKLIKMILENFDFEEVHDAMVKNNWAWAGSNGVPTIEELRQEATRALEEVAFSKGKYFQAGSGGFEAERYKGTIILRFVWKSAVADKDWLEE